MPLNAKSLEEFSKACQGEGIAIPAIGQGICSFISSLQVYSCPWLAESFDKGLWGGTGLEPMEGVVRNVSITFNLKMLIQLICVIDKFFLVCKIKHYRTVPNVIPTKASVLPRECIPQTFSSAFTNVDVYLWHQFHVFYL